jgi:tRNA-2-methylthio-N6-dimethylallyladenosine synthase
MTARANDNGLIQLGRRATSTTQPEAADGPRVYIETYGCQMNVADTDMVRGLLGGEGFRRTERADDADVILLNTCAVREKAEDRVLARARELGSHKQRRPVALGVIGCMAEHLKDSLLERAPQVDIVVGPDSYRRLAGLIREARDRGAAVRDSAAAALPALVDVKLDKAETYDGLSGAEGGDGVSGFVTIQRGCDKCCTFCIVPLTRGRERGVAPREVLRQVRAFRDAGYKEVVLLGQTVNSYAHDDVGFAELLRAVAQVDGIERIRFTSPYPIDFKADVVEVLATEPKVCGYVHLPLQSGSDRVLDRMRRGYGVDEFRAIVTALRAASPAIAISTDILTGFCGETDADHEQTLAVMQELRFDSAFMFLYSERSGTYASRKLRDDVPLELKKQRLQQIIALQEKISAEVFAAQVGKTERVLIHARSKRRSDQLVGRTDGFKSVVFDVRAGLEPGDFANVAITRSTMATLFGELV